MPKELQEDNGRQWQDKLGSSRPNHLQTQTSEAKWKPSGAPTFEPCKEARGCRGYGEKGNKGPMDNGQWTRLGILGSRTCPAALYVNSAQRGRQHNQTCWSIQQEA